MAIKTRSRRDPRVEAWLKKEWSEQEARYRRIVKEMDALGPRRDQWIKEFLQRIQTRGFNVHSAILRKIKPEEIPERPKRKFKVVF